MAVAEIATEPLQTLPLTTQPTGGAGGQDQSASPPALALPPLNPADSPYAPLALPEVAAPAQHPLADQQPQPNLGAVSKGGAIAYMADQVLRGAIRGYDQQRLQKAQQFNKKLSALSALEKDLGQQYKDAYNEVGSSSPSMTPQQILEDPKVKQLHNQLLAVHQTTQQAIQSYLPPLTTDKKTGKQKEKKNVLQRMFDHQDNPDEALRAYSEAAQQLGPQAFYQVARPDQLKSMYAERQGRAAGQTAATAQAGAAGAAAGVTADKAKLEEEKLNPATTPARRAQIDELLTPLTSRQPTADQMKRQDYTRLLDTGQLPKDKDGNPLSYEAWVPFASAQGRAAGAPPKAPVMKNGVSSNGHNVAAYYDTNQKSWIDSNTSEPIKFYPAPTFAQTGLYEPILTATPDGRLASGTFNRRTGETRAETIGTGGPLAAPVAREVSKSLEPAVEADTRYKIMHDNAIDALKGNQQAMVSLLMNHIGMTLGAQKGTRVAKSVIDEAQQSAPWTQTIFAKWGHDDANGDWVYDGYKTGTNLSGQQIHQMLGLAKQRRERQWQQAQEGAKVYGVSITPPPLDTGLGGKAESKPGKSTTAPAKPPHAMSDDEFLLAVPKAK